jgi:hypothetical protein
MHPNVQQPGDLDSYPYTPRPPIDSSPALEQRHILWDELISLVPLAEIIFFALACLFNLADHWFDDRLRAA